MITTEIAASKVYASNSGSIRRVFLVKGDRVHFTVIRANPMSHYRAGHDYDQNIKLFRTWADKDVTSEHQSK